MTVPGSWIRSTKKVNTDVSGEEDGFSRGKKLTGSCYCFWPQSKTADEKYIRNLISTCSDPDVQTWQCLPGVLKGFFSSVKEAESMISEKIGTRSAESDVERLSCMGDKAAAQRGKEPKKSDTKKVNSHRGLFPAFSTTQRTVSSPSQQHSTTTPMVPLETMYPATPPSRTLTSVTSGMQMTTKYGILHLYNQY